jgi:hypothetical protein
LWGKELKRGSEVLAPSPILFHFPHGSCSPISLHHTTVTGGDNQREIREHKQKKSDWTSERKKEKQKSKKQKAKMTEKII